MTQFIRGLPTSNRIHTLTQGTDTCDGATRIATLFEATQTFGQDESTVTLQQQGTSVKEQNFNIVDPRIQCAYCKKNGLRGTNKPRSVYYDILCFNCNGTGHIASDCHRGPIQKPKLQGTNYYRPNLQNQGHPFRQDDYYYSRQNQETRENVYQGYRQSTF